MKNLLLLSTLTFILITTSAQEFADFEITGTNEGTGSFDNSLLSNFNWNAIGAIYELEILNNEIFDDGNEFENTFGQADYADNLCIQNYPNGEGTEGQTVLSVSQLTISFDQTTPSSGWGFCITDIDVENCLISAADENDNEVSVEIIDEWLIELFDCDLVEDGLNIPSWDPTHAALLGSDTPEDYVVYNNLVIGGLASSEAPAAFFMPDIPLKELSVQFENLQAGYFTSYHLYIASLNSTGIHENETINFSVYPNPASRLLNIKLPEFNNNMDYQLSLFNAAGMNILHSEIQSAWYTVNINHLPEGIYYARVLVQGQSVTKKIVLHR